MKIVVDAHIPFAEQLFSTFGTVVSIPGGDVTRAALRDVDMLLVRSITRVDGDLLKGTPVRFVGTATAGTDHVDLEFLAREGIAFAYAPGSNADSVADYVVAALLAVSCDAHTGLPGGIAGVVGYGEVGSRVARRLEGLGLEVMVCDPPRARAGMADRRNHPLESLLAAADVLTLHVPLTRLGADPTWHMIGEAELAQMRPESVLINTSRGGVVDGEALLQALVNRRLGAAILDVWENEPTPDPRLIDAAAIATPHIAGYSFDGKIAGALALADALTRWLGRTPDPALRRIVAPKETLSIDLPRPSFDEVCWLDEVARQAYDVRADDAAMRELVRLPPDERGRRFTDLRATYPVRRGFEWYAVGGDLPERFRNAVSQGIGVAMASDGRQVR